MKRRKFMAGLALLPTIPFLGWGKVQAKPKMKLYTGMTKEAEFKINTRMFITRVKDAMEELRFEMSNQENLQLFKTWLDITIAKVTPDCFAAVSYGVWYEDNMFITSFQIWFHGLTTSTPYLITLRMIPGKIKQDGII